MKRVGVLVFDGCTALTAVGPADIIRKASTIHHARTGSAAFEVLLVGVSGARVETDSGLPLYCNAALDEVEHLDLVMVPALEGDPVSRAATEGRCVAWLRNHHLRGGEVASFCTGAFLLAEAGLLDGKRATTHWAFEASFRRHFPAVELQPEAIIVDEGRLTTAGGATSFLNLAIYLVEKHCGAETARTASRVLLIDRGKAPQSAYAIFSGQKGHGDAAILRAQALIEEHFGDVGPIATLAARVAMSTRNFTRRFKTATGNSPFEYIRRVRIERAKRLFESRSDASVATVAAAVGYDDIGSFRALFEHTTGMAPREYRRRYGSAHS
ncbi:MAG: helix-turn-helix domain-containing protein [Spirochaetales bacterium]|nr:helix-turn-helix domain-containing protein [Spirochaetales bacterium]